MSRLPCEGSVENSRHVAVQLETPRLILRQWQAADAEPFAAMNADPDVMRYFPACLDRKKSDQLLEKIQGLITTQGWGFWALQRKSDQAFLGLTGLHHCPDHLPLASLLPAHAWPALEIGWRLRVVAWHQGYATEAAQAAMRFAFDQLELTQLVAFTASRNHPSQAVMARLSMEKVGEFSHPDVPVASPLQPHVLYTRAYFPPTSVR